MQMVCFEVYPRGRNLNKMRRILVNKHMFIEKENRYGCYFYTEVPSIDVWQTKTMLNAHNYEYKSFDRRYERSSNYRDTFFSTHVGPYRCAYCGRRLKTEYLEVDHLIPVAKAKNSMVAKTFLHLGGMDNVNDSKNLVSSCSRCNRKKSDKAGLWVIRGMLGRHKWFWRMRNMFILTTIGVIAAIAWVALA